MYKDKDKQREANRQASKRYRLGMTLDGMTKQGMMQNKPKGMTVIIPKTDIRVIPKGTAMGITTEPLDTKPKPAKDIKVFADLPPDVQQTIDKMSRVGGAIDQTIKANRTAIAINYQHLFPDRYHSTGV